MEETQFRGPRSVRAQAGRAAKDAARRLGAIVGNARLLQDQAEIVGVSTGLSGRRRCAGRGGHRGWEAGTERGV